MGKVLKANGAAAEAYVNFTWDVDQPQVWVTCRILYFADALVFWRDNTSAYLIRVGTYLGTNDAAVFVATDGVDPEWVLHTGPGGATGVEPPAGGAWFTLDFHYFGVDGTTELYVDGVLVAVHTSSSVEETSSFAIGFDGGGSPPAVDAASVVYFDDVKAGTVFRGDDLFSDDFEGGDLSAWTHAVGDVSVVDDPLLPPNEVFALDRPSWRWIMTDLRTSRVLTSLTTMATDITTSRLLAASWPASLTVPSDDPRVRTTYLQFDGHPEWDEPFVAKDIRALIGFRNTGLGTEESPLWECAYAGIVKQVLDRVVDGVPQTTINCWDARKYLEFLPLVDADGALPDADGITFTSTKANVIARAALENWITNNPGCLAETLFDLSSGLDEDCAELTMVFERGTTINDVWTQLEQAGAIDIVLDPPFDPRSRPGCIAVVNFEVEHGEQRHAAIFSWDRSPRSLPEISRMEDGLKDANTIQDYTGDVEPATVATESDSVERIGEYWAMRAWPGQTDVDAVTAFAAAEIFFRTNGQTTVSATPAAPRSLQPIQEYDIGDRVPVYASERLRKPIASTMRIYGIPFTIDESAHETVADLIVSADAVSA